MREKTKLTLYCFLEFCFSLILVIDILDLTDQKEVHPSINGGNIAAGIFLFISIIFLAWKIYELFYYMSAKFSKIRDRISTYINDCNDLNEHIESLKDTTLLSNQTDYGETTYHDSSRWNYQRKYLKGQTYAPNICDCSRNVCNNAKAKPFYYICKYFGIKTKGKEGEKSLEYFEDLLNNFEAAEEGKKRLQDEKKKILNSIQNEIPFLIKKFSKRKLEYYLGFEPIDLSTNYFPEYVFRYVSSGGNASTECSIIMDIDNLNRFVLFLSEKIKFEKSAAGQRALMTSKLRQHIKERDNFTCKKCGASIYKEPNLLLEIDHIIPVSKGGLTAEDNLQTLCWRCYRKKGAKI